MTIRYADAYTTRLHLRVPISTYQTGEVTKDFAKYDIPGSKNLQLEQNIPTPVSLAVQDMCYVSLPNNYYFCCYVTQSIYRFPQASHFST